MTTRLKSVLVVDEDEALRHRIAEILKKRYRVSEAPTAELAIERLLQSPSDIIVIAMRLSGGLSGLDALPILRENFRTSEVVALIDARDAAAAGEAMALGACHCLARTAPGEVIVAAVREASARQDLYAAPPGAPRPAADLTQRDFVVGRSRAAREVIAVGKKVAPLSATVLILGESGTGKELLARFIHKESGRPDAPFIGVNLAAIPRDLVESTLFGHEKGSFTGAVRQQVGKFESANGGVLFLDEVGDLRLDLQAKLLRAIQEGEIERIGGVRPIKTTFRLIAATNVDLEKAVKAGTFREDLYYRLKVIPITMPPLRERLEDLPDLVRFFLKRYNARFHRDVKGVSDAAMQRLTAYWWPGNIRELENLIERLVAVVDKPWVEEEDLPFELHFTRLDAAPAGGAGLFEQACASFERHFILKALERSDWNVAATARYLGMPLSTLKYKMDRLEVRDLARRFRRS